MPTLNMSKGLSDEVIVVMHYHRTCNGSQSPS